MSPGDSAQPG
ncbi:Protein of unknown function [Propionibacterium freudenreichii]|nr:Protein of unknown function [Propionibacterium freudenreichii subsp. freudenreichii]CEG85800.1 Protein of unknown function [Propionibacterium freudenreichii]CEG88279.1 Protein of unknown function [Propionibacterium freudenreichii]CEG91988.1 Protein of unknown function [Propionibacterium freudenreichii]CEG95907.1 Protein of unknown function [Propionibacterium freudenreichii]